MVTRMSDEQLRPIAEHYGIVMREARRRHTVMLAHKDDRNDPICLGCAKRPYEINGYRIAAHENEGDPAPTDAQITRWVIENEGTFNRQNGHLLCDQCYIINGCPTSDQGWVCP